jgi:hypothetical protein
MSSAVLLSVAKRPPSDLAAHLRELADSVDAGQVLEYICCYTFNDEFCFKFGASKLNGIAMASMLHSEALERMRE